MAGFFIEGIQSPLILFFCFLLGKGYCSLEVITLAAP